MVRAIFVLVMYRHWRCSFGIRVLMGWVMLAAQVFIFCAKGTNFMSLCIHTHARNIELNVVRDNLFFIRFAFCLYLMQFKLAIWCFSFLFLS